MKKILILFLILSIQAGADELDKKDVFQAEQWMKTIKVFWEVGDYPALRYYCQKTIEFYPETFYAKEAKKYLRKTKNPKANRRRENFRNDPALFFKP
jgi:hypothetical protein